MIQKFISRCDTPDIHDIGILFLANLFMFRGEELFANKTLDKITSGHLGGRKELIRGILAMPNHSRAFEHFEKGAKTDGFCAYAAATFLIKSKLYNRADQLLIGSRPVISALVAQGVLRAVRNDPTAENILLSGLEFGPNALIYINLAIIYRDQNRFEGWSNDATRWHKRVRLPYFKYNPLESCNMITRAIECYPNDQFARYFRYYLSSDAQRTENKAEDLRYIINYELE